MGRVAVMVGVSVRSDYLCVSDERERQGGRWKKTETTSLEDDIDMMRTGKESE